MLDTQSHQWKTIVGVVAFLASVATIIALIVQLESRDRDATTVKEQVASQGAQIALQKTQIALSTDHNRILAEQGTVTAKQAQAQQQLYVTPAVNDGFSPTATTLAKANANAQATQQALEIQRQRIEATQTAIARPQPTTAMMAKGELLYQDTFDDSSGWIIEEGVRIENGTMIISPRYDAVPKDPVTYADFAFEARFYIPATGSMAFYVRHQRPACPGWNCSIQIALYYDNNISYREVVARRWLGDKPSQQFDIAKNQSVSALHPDQWNTITVLAKGREYRVYINDASILSFSDSTYASGAFVMDNAGPTNEVKIDYIRIYTVR